jgi:tRNA pseudouridine55 synthase
MTATSWETLCQKWIGMIEQIPSKYSAIKVGGKPCYVMARKGKEVMVPARTIQIYENRFLSWQPPCLRLMVRCGGGAYIRTLIEDMAKDIGTVAHVSALHRHWVAPFKEAPMQSLSNLSIEACFSLRAMVAHYPEVHLSMVDAEILAHGQWVPCAQDDQAVCVVFDEVGALVAIGSIQSGVLKPRKVFYWAQA